MKRTVKHIPDRSLLAIYLALRAARKGATRVVISNNALKTYLGMEKVHKPRIDKFAASLKPIFPRHSIGSEHYGLKNCLFLYLNENKDDSLPTTREYVRSIPSQVTIDQALSVQLVELV